MLTSLAIGLVVLSPISGVQADRYGSRALATSGMVITALGLAGLTTLGTTTAAVSAAYG
jgi:MFS family permease